MVTTIVESSSETTRASIALDLGSGHGVQASEMKQTNARVRIKLALVEATSPELVSMARGVATAIPGNVNLTPADIAKLPVQAPELLVNAKTLEDTHGARGTSPSKTNTALETSARDTVMTNLTDTAGAIEALAHAKAAGDPTHAVAIITSFGFLTRAEPHKHARMFEFLAGAAKGSFHVRMPGTPGDVTHANIVQYSIDAEKTWSFPMTVLGVDLIVTGLKSATSVAARYVTVLAPPKGTKHTVAAGSEEPTWSDPINFVIP